MYIPDNSRGAGILKQKIPDHNLKMSGANPCSYLQWFLKFELTKIGTNSQTVYLLNLLHKFESNRHSNQYLKKMKKAYSIYFMTAFLMAFAVSCTKMEPRDEIVDDLNIETPAAFIQEDIELEDLMEDLFMEIDDLDFWMEGFKSATGDNDCRIVTIDPLERNVFPKTITIDFGAGCEVREGVIKKGKIIIEMSAAPFSEQWQKTIRFDGYSVNDRSFEGGKKISFLKEGRRGLPSWQINSRLKIQWDEESFVQHTSERIRVQTSGFDTPRRPMDDAFIISGEGTGINRQGKGYKKTITEPLHVSKDCRWIKKGVISLQVRGESESVLDYGDGTCDNIATITKDGETREITLKRR